jgi:hypothetical protein
MLRGISRVPGKKFSRHAIAISRGKKRPIMRLVLDGFGNKMFSGQARNDFALLPITIQKLFRYANCFQGLS